MSRRLTGPARFAHAVAPAGAALAAASPGERRAAHQRLAPGSAGRRGRDRLAAPLDAARYGMSTAAPLKRPARRSASASLARSSG